MSTPLRAFLLHEQRQHASIAIEPVVRDFAVAEETHQRQVAQRLADHLEFARIRPEEARAAAQTRKIDAPARLRVKALAYAFEHARHILPRGAVVASAEHDAAPRLEQLADRNELVRRVDADEIAHEVVPSVAPRDR